MTLDVLSFKTDVNGVVTEVTLKNGTVLSKALKLEEEKKVTLTKSGTIEATKGFDGFKKVVVKIGKE